MDFHCVFVYLFSQFYFCKNGKKFNHYHKSILSQKSLKKDAKEDLLTPGGGIRRGDHLPPHNYIKNTSTCGTTPTEHLLNAGRRPETSQKTRNSPHTWVGQKKIE